MLWTQTSICVRILGKRAQTLKLANPSRLLGILEAAILTEQGQKPLPCHSSSFRAIYRKGFALFFLK
jgi:hypothetical protein